MTAAKVFGGSFIVDRLASLDLPQRQMEVYDREIGIRLIHEDPDTGVEHYVVRYPPGMRATLHRHTPGQTIVVLEGRLKVNDQEIGPGSWCHFPPGEPMLHEPAGDEGCLFVTIFHGPSDVEPVRD